MAFIISFLIEDTTVGQTKVNIKIIIISEKIIFTEYSNKKTKTYFYK